MADEGVRQSKWNKDRSEPMEEDDNEFGWYRSDGWPGKRSNERNASDDGAHPTESIEKKHAIVAVVNHNEHRSHHRVTTTATEEKKEKKSFLCRLFSFQMSRSNSDGMKIIVGEGYAWILFQAVLITIHMWITGMLMGSVRRKFFTKEFYEKNFPKYKQLASVMTPDGGYPDDGQGRLADLLSDEQWFTLNNYRRAHYNYLEVTTGRLSPLSLTHRRWFRERSPCSFLCSSLVFRTRV